MFINPRGLYVHVVILTYIFTYICFHSVVKCFKWAFWAFRTLLSRDKSRWAARTRVCFYFLWWLRELVFQKLNTRGFCIQWASRAFWELQWIGQEQWKSIRSKILDPSRALRPHPVSVCWQSNREVIVMANSICCSTKNNLASIGSGMNKMNKKILKVKVVV